jgi:anti-sigma factor RsiW
VRNLLSAYLDAELAGTEMLDIRDHLSRCPSCAREQEGLRETKRLLGALALRLPQDTTAFEAHLRQSVAQQAAWGGLGWVPAMVSAWRQGALATSLTPHRVRTLTTATALSLAGLLLGTITLDRAGVGVLGTGPSNGRVSGAAAYFASLLPTPGYGVLPPYIAQHLVRQNAPPLADTGALMSGRSSRDNDLSSPVSATYPVQPVLWEMPPPSNDVSAPYGSGYRQLRWVR